MSEIACRDDINTVGFTNFISHLPRMLYAIVDIETTGGHASANGITEVSIQVFDGEQVVERFETLINPQAHIPYYITGLTGISNEMVANAPTFAEVAEQIYEVLQGKVFVAHSVNFDYSFLNHALAECGYHLHSSKLCTVRLSRKIFPGLTSYSLGKICNYLGINIHDRHRAGGDAEATVQLFGLLLKNDKENIIKAALKRNSHEQSLPPNVPRKDFEQLPHVPGVYYFYDQKGKVVYVGKAKDLKKRVSSHFKNNSPNRQKQNFVRSIHRITYTECGNELMALLLESHEIKRLWPKFNSSQKRFEPSFGIVDYLDQKGFRRLGIARLNKSVKAIMSFNSVAEGYHMVTYVAQQHRLCLRLSGIVTDITACQASNCDCLKDKPTAIKAYNKRVDKAIDLLGTGDSFVIVEEGRHHKEKACVVVEKGSFKGMGYIPNEHIHPQSIDPKALEELPTYKENFNIRQIIFRYRETHPESVIALP